MRSVILAVASMIVCYNITFAEVQLKQVKSNSVDVFFHEASDEFIERVVEKAEEYRQTISESFGIPPGSGARRRERVRIYVWDDAAQFRAHTDQAEWSAGSAFTRERVIHTHAYAPSFFDTVLPHELGHIIFRQYVGLDNQEIPLWLDEGAAFYAQRLRSPGYLLVIKQAIREGTFIPLDALTQMRPAALAQQSRVDLFYAEAASLVSFLMRECGRSAVLRLCRSLAAGGTLDQAFSRACGVADLRTFERDWVRYLDSQ